MGTRRAAVAGSWYPREAVDLAAAIDDYLARVGPGEPRAGVKALIAPHAGLMYSGPVAAHAYAAVRHARYDAVVLVGPSHFVPFDGVSVWPRGVWETPFGPVPVAEALADLVAGGNSAVHERPAAHAREHALEMQLPFLARLFPQTPVVPLVMGEQRRRTSEELGRAIAGAVETWRANTRGATRSEAAAGGGDLDVLLVASSDLSHYEDAATAAVMDGRVLRHVEACDPDGLMTLLEREPGHACGGGPMVAVMHAARQLGASEAAVLRYADSGDVSGDKTAVVGYMAAALW